MKRGRPSRSDIEQREKEQQRETAIADLDRIALQGAADAMKTLVAAAAGAKIDAAALGAATYIVNRVAGKPVDAERTDDATTAIRTLLEDVRNVRIRDSRGDDDSEPWQPLRQLGTLTGGNAGLLEQVQAALQSDA